MDISRRTVSIGALSLLASTSISVKAGVADGIVSDLMEGSEEFGLAVEACTYGYPLVTVEMTRRIATNVHGRIHPHAPHVLAEGEVAFDHRWKLDGTAGDEGELNAAATVVSAAAKAVAASLNLECTFL
jgi:hypothetical protein